MSTVFLLKTCQGLVNWYIFMLSSILPCMYWCLGSHQIEICASEFDEDVDDEGLVLWVGVRVTV